METKNKLVNVGHNLIPIEGIKNVVVYKELTKLETTKFVIFRSFYYLEVFVIQVAYEDIVLVLRFRSKDEVSEALESLYAALLAADLIFEHGE